MSAGLGELLLVAVVDAGLTAGEREVFIDGAVIGRPYREIAAARGCSKQNVSRLLQQARRRLEASAVVGELRAAA